MDRWDWKRELKALYQPKAGVVSEIDVPEMSFLMIDGAGDPNGSPEFVAAVSALYTISYTLKFARKKAGAGPEYSVMPLEGLWWAPDLAVFGSDHDDKSSWLWTAMIAQPPFVKADEVEAARSEAIAKKGAVEAAAVRFEPYAEGPSVQIMHIGPFATEGPDIAALHARIAELGSRPSGHHHEIYLSDPARTAPEKLKTVVRQSYAR
jgi:hypothetical protein